MKNKEIEELLDYYQKEIDKYEETKQYLMEKYGYDEETIDNISQHQRYKNNKLLLSYIEQLENKCESLLENKNETLRYISNYLALDQRYKWNDNVDEKLKLVKKFLNGREKTNTNISYEDLLRQNEQLENNRDKAINHLDLFISETNLSKYDTLKILIHTKKLLKGDSDYE